jgi:hypothetical protein
MNGLLPWSIHCFSHSITLDSSRLSSAAVNRRGFAVNDGGAASIVQVSGDANHHVSVWLAPTGEVKQDVITSKLGGFAMLGVCPLSTMKLDGFDGR